MNAPLSPDAMPGLGRARSDFPFYAGLLILGGVYVLLILALLVAEASFTSPDHLLTALASPEIRYAIKLSLVSCTMTTILALWAAVPLGYLLSRYRFPGRTLLDAVLDIPIVLPPLVIGLALLILFQTPAGRLIEDHVIGVTFAIPGVILAQFTVATAFAVRAMRVTFDQISPRQEQVALTLGCSRGQAFWWVVLPQARRGLVTAATLAWARSLGEFGPILIFAGATRLRTEVLPTTVFLELSVGNIEVAVAVSLLMVLAAAAVLVIVRVFGMDGTAGHVR
jgi:molybdate transport system permease protein